MFKILPNTPNHTSLLDGSLGQNTPLRESASHHISVDSRAEFKCELNSNSNSEREFEFELNSNSNSEFEFELNSNSNLA